jgi:hypothetical protein
MQVGRYRYRLYSLPGKFNLSPLLFTLLLPTVLLPTGSCVTRLGLPECEEPVLQLCRPVQGEPPLARLVIPDLTPGSGGSSASGSALRSSPSRS